MARVLKEEEHELKRNQILDAALNLIYTKGYAQISIQDILDALNISKGAFYHYFDSKQAFCDALVGRLGKAAEEDFLALMQEPNLSAVQKIRLYLESAVRLTTMQKTSIIDHLHTWYADENALIRQKVAAEWIRQTARLLEPIMRQGLEEQLFMMRFPEQASVIVADITLRLTDTIIGLFLAPHQDQAISLKLEVTLAAYIDTVEKIVGAPSGSLKIFEKETFKEWFAMLKSKTSSHL